MHVLTFNCSSRCIDFAPHDGSYSHYRSWCVFGSDHDMHQNPVTSYTLDDLHIETTNATEVYLSLLIRSYK